jgi:hypothetical protein
MRKIYRQGDIIIKQIEELPQNLKVVSRENQFILAEGEQTGHRHTLVAKPKTMEILQDENGRYYLKFSNAVELIHPEHKAITISGGIYEVGNEREYDYFLEETRRVQD